MIEEDRLKDEKSKVDDDGYTKYFHWDGEKNPATFY